MIAFQIIIIVALTIGLAYAAWWCLIELYVKLTVKGSPESKTCTAREEMEHYQTLLDEWGPVEGSPLHESLVDAIADAQVRADAEITEDEWRVLIKVKERRMFDHDLRFVTSYNSRDIQRAQERAEKVRRDIDELKARRDKARKYLADSRRAV